MMILTRDIKEYCKNRKRHIQERISSAAQPPLLAIVEVGENPASIRYIRNKMKDCQEVGIISHRYYFEPDITTEDLVLNIKDLQEHYDGVIVQMPLPSQIDTQYVKMAINPKKDVDGFHPLSLYTPCTPKGIVDYLTNGCDYDFTGKNITIIGRSDIVGKPLATILMERNATVTVCHSKTKDIWEHIETADLVIVAVGKAKFLNCYAIYKPVIDVGINFDENGKLCGDCFNIENRDVTPVPGGVGLLTRVALLENVCNAAGIKIQV